MALQVWLPLNGTLENKGLSNVTVTNNGATVDNNGKIGKCYLTNGSAAYINCGNYTSGKPNRNISICMWFLAKNVSGNLLFAGSRHGSNLRLYLGLLNNVLSFGAGGTGLSSGGRTISANTWYHLALVFDSNGQATLYINNTVAETRNTGSFNFTGDFDLGRGNNGESYKNALFNDVRIYDHALSAKEVKEISKGLILHYKLDGNDIGITIPRNGGLIPDGVELYDYILSSGTLWIDTGWTPDYDKGFEIEAKYNASSSGSRGFVIGSYNASNSTSLEILSYSRFYLHSGNVDNHYTITLDTTHIIKCSYLNGSWSHTVDGGTPNTGTVTYTGRSGNTAYMFLDRALRTSTFNKLLKVYYVTIREQGKIVLNMLPCTYLGEPGMWDTVENKFYRNQGTGLFTLGNRITLKEYEYLLLNGNYINTGFIPNLDTKIEAELLLYDNVLTAIFGSRAKNSGSCKSFMVWNGTNDEFAFLYGNNNWDLGKFTIAPSSNSRFSISLDKNIGTLSTGSTVTYQYHTFSSNCSLLIGTTLTSGTPDNRYTKENIYIFKIWDNGKLIRDYVPVSYNGTPGLWDKVEWKFYANAGSGSFTLGPEKTIQQDAPIFYDSSGYCNHGSITGTLTTNSDSPRYTASCFRDTSAWTTITKQNLSLPDGPVTLSFWSKPQIITTDDTSKIQITFSKFYYFTYINYPHFIHDTNYNYMYNNFWSDDKWHLVTCTYDGSTAKMYIDGILINPLLTTTTTTYKDNLTLLLKGNSMSDFRIYATALSEEDIKELYNTSAFVTNNGVFAEYELYEDNLSDVKKRGLLETANFYENGAESGYALDTDKTRVASNYIISEDFIEI